MEDMNRIDRFHEIAMQHQSLMRDILVVPPVRPHDGLSVDLSCMLSAWYNVGIQWRPKEDMMGGFIEFTRMNIADQFLRQHTQKYLLMIDNDTDPPIELPWLLARHDAPVVGSCIVSNSPKGRPMLCFSRPDASGTNRMIDFMEGDKIPATGLAEVPHCGTGAMMIRRDVLESFTMEKLPNGQWDVPFLVDQDVKVRGMRCGKLIEGEDIRFCKQVRAKGFKVYVDLEAHCGHRKIMKMTFPDSQRDPSLRVENWVVSDKGMVMSDD